MAKFDVSSTSSGHAVTSIVHANLWLYGMQLAVGLSCSAFGGYVAAWIAKRDELLNGLLSSFLCVAIGLYSIFLGKGDQSLLAQILLLPTGAAFALLRGYLRQTPKRTSGHEVPFALDVDGLTGRA